MDARRFPNFGDAEFTPRLRKAGWRLVIDPRARVSLPAEYRAPTGAGAARPARWSHALLVDLKHPSNLRRRFYAYWHGAPTPLHGMVALAMFLARWGLGWNIEGGLGDRDGTSRRSRPPTRIGCCEAPGGRTAPRRDDRTAADRRPTARRRVVYAWNYVEWGGAQVYFYALMREAARHAAVEVLLPVGSHPRVLATLERLGMPYTVAFPAMDAAAAPTVRPQDRPALGQGAIGDGPRAGPAAPRPGRCRPAPRSGAVAVDDGTVVAGTAGPGLRDLPYGAAAPLVVARAACGGSSSACWGAVPASTS